jgi:hypothetical protein
MMMRSLRDFKLMGETWESWGEIARDLSWKLFKSMLQIALFLGAVYALVKFIKWAWTN